MYKRVLLTATVTSVALLSPAFAQSLNDTISGSVGSPPTGTVSSTASDITSQASQTNFPGSNVVANRVTGLNADQQLESVPTLNDAEDIIGQSVVAIDDVILGTVVEVRKGRIGCPILVVSPNASLGGNYRRVLVQPNSCEIQKNTIRVSMSSKKFIRTIRN